MGAQRRRENKTCQNWIRGGWGKGDGEGVCVGIPLRKSGDTLGPGICVREREEVTRETGSGHINHTQSRWTDLWWDLRLNSSRCQTTAVAVCLER
jgi:hypothetical protein